MNDQVDVLLATCQGGCYLNEQLQSILAQTYPNVHVIIRDDLSSDQTMQIIKKWSQAYPKQVTVLQSSCRLGIKGNFSELMKQSRAPYVMLSDQDDVWLPQKIQSSLSTLKEMERRYGYHLPLLVHTNLKVVDQRLNGISPSFWRYTGLDPSLNTLNRILPQNIATGCTMIMNRPLVDLATPVPKEAVMHDWWIAIAASCFGHIHHCHEPSILYRQHGNNDTGATPYSIWHYLKHHRKAKNPEQTYQQAAAFLSRYGRLLNPDQMNILKGFVELGRLPYLKKQFHILKHQYLKQGLLRNIYFLLHP